MLMKNVANEPKPHVNAEILAKSKIKAEEPKPKKKAAKKKKQAED